MEAFVSKIATVPKQTERELTELLMELAKRGFSLRKDIEKLAFD